MANQKSVYQTPPSFALIDGIFHYPGVTEKYLQELQSLPLNGDEMFLATYPKSGTTWLSEVTSLIYSDGRTDSRPARDRIIYLEGLPLRFRSFTTKKELNDFITNVAQPRLLKTHLPHHLAPKSADPLVKPKHIYLMRNPKDCAVSYYHHYKGFKMHEFDESWDVFFELFMNNEAMYGSWFDHVLGWWAHRDDPNYLVLKYEDMLKDLPSTIQRIAQFVGKTLSSEVVQKIADETSFSAMSQAKGRFYDGEEDFEKDFRGAGATKFLRKGEVGDWRNFFTEDQSRRMDEVYREKLAGSGLDFDFLPPNST